MTGQLLDGKALAKEIRAGIADKVAVFKEKTNVTPKLSVVMIGEHAPSKIYVSHKQKACQKAGMKADIHHIKESVSQEELISTIQTLNDDERVHGILVQLPLPKGIDTLSVLNAVSPKKDVDGLSFTSQGRLLEGDPGFYSATAKAVMRLLEKAGTKLEGKEVVVVGASLLVGKPLALLLLNKNATVTVCHKHTQNLKAHTLRADVLISATGVTHLITPDHVKEGAVVIDVGTTKVGERVLGDVDYKALLDKVKAVTPVPGGVGPVTVACVVEATYHAALNQTEDTK